MRGVGISTKAVIKELIRGAPKKNAGQPELLDQPVVGDLDCGEEEAGRADDEHGDPQGGDGDQREAPRQLCALPAEVLRRGLHVALPDGLRRKHAPKLDQPKAQEPGRHAQRTPSSDRRHAPGKGAQGQPRVFYREGKENEQTAPRVAAVDHLRVAAQHVVEHQQHKGPCARKCGQPDPGQGVQARGCAKEEGPDLQQGGAHAALLLVQPKLLQLPHRVQVPRIEKPLPGAQMGGNERAARKRRVGSSQHLGGLRLRLLNVRGVSGNLPAHNSDSSWYGNAAGWNSRCASFRPMSARGRPYVSRSTDIKSSHP